jgi:enamine deaminase RidA (YjgF/YER057c/UK114 family)
MTGSSARRLVSSGGPWEGSAGYSRAVVVGDGCWVSGTTDAGPDGRSRHPADPGGQARAALDTIERALAQAGFTLADVVRTRMFVTERASIVAVLAAHGERFAAFRPAATIVVVSGLIDPSLLVEIEAEARRQD